MDIILESDF